MAEPWSKFFWSDWEADQGLRLCSLAAQGLWMRMLCVCARHEPKGYLAINGNPLGLDAIARLAGVAESEAGTLLAELDLHGVFSRNRSGCIYSRRMVRDEKRSQEGRKHKKRGLLQATDIKDKLPPPSRVSTRGASPHIPEARSQNEADASTSGRMDGRQIAGLIERLIEAAGGNVAHGASGIEVAKPILDLQAMGCDLEADILPAIAEAIPKLPEPLRTWGAGFLRDRILARQAARLRNRGAASMAPPNETSAQMRKRLGMPDPETRDAGWWKPKVEAFYRCREWVEWLCGPQPGAPGCIAPQEWIDLYRPKPRQPSAA